MSSRSQSSHSQDQSPKPRDGGSKLLQSLRLEILQLNFYRVHMAYFIVVILIFSVIMYGSGIADNPTEDYGGRLEFIDALFICTSAMTSTGLTTVNLNILTAFQQALLAILIILGNVVFVGTSVVVLRRHYFRKKLSDVMEHSKAGQKVRQIIDEERAEQNDHPTRRRSSDLELNGEAPVRVLSSPASDSQPLVEDRNANVHRRKPTHVEQAQSYKKRRAHNQTGLGFFPAPWQVSGVREAFHWPFQRMAEKLHQTKYDYFSFEPHLDHKGRFHSLQEEERRELGGVEYRALGLLMLLLPIYLIGWLTLGTVFLVPYSYRPYVKNVITTTQTGYTEPGWWSFFTVLSSFGNCGLGLLNSSFQMFQSTYFILIVVGLLNIAGNTQFPVFLRLFIWLISKVAPNNSDLHHTVSFLLNHPRRVFIYLFPSIETWYLFGIQTAIELLSWVLFVVLNLGVPYVMSIPPGPRAAVGLFTSLGLRTGGFYAVTISFLAPALQVFHIVVMYISSFPIIMAIRQTNTYEEQSIGLDTTEESKKSNLSTHIQNQLAYDLWFLIGAWFLICIVERPALMGNHPGFLIFNILFEVTSAYGTVGLTTGVPYDSYSLSGAFHKFSKVVMLFVMVRGRHRGLPMAIDRSILFPGQKLLQQMDEEYERHGRFSEDAVKEIRRDQQESGAKETEPGEGMADQDPSGECDRNSSSDARPEWTFSHQ